MRAGLLRDSLIVERLSEPYSADNAVLTADSAIVSTDSATIDEYGNQAPHAWATQIAAQPAHIMPMGGNEVVRADRLSGMVKFEISFRWSNANAAILATDRFVLARECASMPSGTVLNVKHNGVDPTGQKRELRFLVESGVAT